MGSPVLYPTVTKYEGTTSANAGKTVSDFAITIDPNNFPPEFVNSGNYGQISNAWHQGELLDETSYKNVTGQYFPVSKSYYQYGMFNYRTDTAILFKQFKQFIKICNCYTDTSGPVPNGTPPGQGFFSVYAYVIKSGAYKKTAETKVLYDQQNPSGIIASVTTTQYQNPANLYPTQITVTTSDTNVNKITRLKYPQDTTDVVSTAMVARNMLTPVLQSKTTKSVAGTETPLFTVQTTYKQLGNLIVKDTVKASTGSLAPESRLVFNRYDAYGHIIVQQKTGDTKHSYIWDYQSVYPIAEVINADSVNIAYTSFEADGSGNWSIGSALRNTNSGITGQQSYNLSNGACTKTGLTTTNPYTVSYWSNTGSSFSVTGSTSVKQGKTINGWTYFEHQVTGTGTVTVSGSSNIDELRLYPTGALMSTSTYTPLIGISSQCDAGNKIIYYEYDGLGRLKDIKDQDGNIIKTIQYHYQGQ
jgi:YD repeat-containing protein